MHQKHKKYYNIKFKKLKQLKNAGFGCLLPSLVWKRSRSILKGKNNNVKSEEKRICAEANDTYSTKINK